MHDSELRYIAVTVFTVEFVGYFSFFLSD